MSVIKPRFVSLKPIVLDYNRVTLNLETTDFPLVSNVTLTLDLPESPSETETQSRSGKQVPDNPYPNVDLALLDDENNEVAQIAIIEHREKDLSLTLHLRNPQPGSNYVAQATMVYNGAAVDSMRSPFTLEISNSSGK